VTGGGNVPVTWAADGKAGTFPAQTVHSGQVHRPGHVPRLRRARRVGRWPLVAPAGPVLWCGGPRRGGERRCVSFPTRNGTPLFPGSARFSRLAGGRAAIFGTRSGGRIVVRPVCAQAPSPAPARIILPGRAGAGRRPGFRPRCGVLRVKPGGHCRRNPLSRRRLGATPVVCRSAMPTRPFRVRQVRMAVSPPSGRQPRLPVNAAPEVIAGSRRSLRTPPHLIAPLQAGPIPALAGAQVCPSHPVPTPDSQDQSLKASAQQSHAARSHDCSRAIRTGTAR
jgi:hypothetical protein